MGSADRQYMRDRPGPGLFGPTVRHSPLLRVILACVAGFVAIGAARGWARIDLATPSEFSVDALREGRLWTPLTMLLVSPGPWGLLWGMIALWVFGRVVEEWTGPRGLWAFLALAHAAGLLAHVAAEATGAATADTSVASGTSGLAMACLVFAALREPGRAVTIWFIPVPVWVLAAVCVGIGVLGALRVTTVASPSLWMAVGGAAYGAAAHRRGATFGLGGSRASAPQRARAAPTRSTSSQERVDALLEKIHRDGIASLDDEERAFLRDASKDYR